jgi:hypothetical protein
MARPPVRSGELEGAAIDLLRELEQDRITGVLRFESDGASGEILLYGGEIAVDQLPRDDGKDPLDVFLALERARYEIHQRLPPLAVAKGDDYDKTGSLAVHVPADLMNYCERGGLTGTLELVKGDRRAEAVYRAGELIAIELDGRDDADLSDVFGWDEGRFHIEVDPDAPARVEQAEAVPAPAKKREDTQKFLRVVEMALVDVIARSEKARSPTRTSPPLPPAPKSRPPVSASPPMRRTDEHTVKLIYLSGEPSHALKDSSTRHVTVGGSRESALTPESDEMAKKRQPVEPEPPAGNPLRALGWLIVALIVGLLILGGLSFADTLIQRATCEGARGVCATSDDCCDGLACQAGRCARE